LTFIEFFSDTANISHETEKVKESKSKEFVRYNEEGKIAFKLPPMKMKKGNALMSSALLVDSLLPVKSSKRTPDKHKDDRKGPKRDRKRESERDVSSEPKRDRKSRKY
jgi:hypothetical protein